MAKTTRMKGTSNPSHPLIRKNTFMKGGGGIMGSSVIGTMKAGAMGGVGNMDKGTKMAGQRKGAK